MTDKNSSSTSHLLKSEPAEHLSIRGVSANRYVVFFALAGSGCAADLATKHWIFSWPELRQGGIYWLWPGHAGFQLSLNEGALFGFGQGFAWIYAAISVVAIVGIVVWLFALGAARDLWLAISLGMITGGILGNLYDRVGLSGELWPPHDPRAGQPVQAVRDWILVQWSDALRWPNFNVADSLLVVGAALLLYHALWQTPPTRDG